MSRKQCCKSITSIPSKCGTNSDSLFDGMREIISKNKDFQTRGGYLSDFLIRNNTTILVNFKRPADSVFVPPPPDFTNFDYALTKAVIENFITKEKNDNAGTAECLFPGSIDVPFEQANEGGGNKIIFKTIKGFQKVIENTNLKILPVNTGLPPPLDIRMSPADIARNDRVDDDVEIVLDIIYTNTATDNFMKDAAGRAYNVGKSKAVNPYTGIFEENVQFISINKFNNQFFYHEKNPSLADKDQ